MTHRQRSCLLPSPTLARLDGRPMTRTQPYFLQCQMLVTAWRGANYIYRLRSLRVVSVLHPPNQLTSQPAMMILITLEQIKETKKRIGLFPSHAGTLARASKAA